mgnify:CR=1 FL=1
MKIIKCVIKKHRTPLQTTYNYPSKWDPTKIHVVAYEEGNELGDVSESCIAIIKDDKYANELLQDPIVTEITVEEANAFGRKHRPQRIVVDDKDLSAVLLAIKKPEHDRTQEEKDLLDEDKEGGIHKTKEFNITDYI